MSSPTPASPGSVAASPEEKTFLAGYDVSQFERPSVAVDVILLAPSGGCLHTLLVRRSEHPCKGLWALPGGFVGMAESLEQAAARVLRDKAGLQDVFLEQLYTFGEPGRDPRTRIITVAYYALVDLKRFGEIEAPHEETVVARLLLEKKKGNPENLVIKGPAGKVLELAFDHARIVAATVQRLRGKIDYTPIAFELLSKAFTLFDLQKVHETVLGKKLNKDSFRRRMLASGQLEATGAIQQDVDHRPAALYRFLRSR